MTLGSFSDICFALGFKPEVKIPVKPVEQIDKCWTRIHKIAAVNPKVVKSSSQQIYLAHDAAWSKVKVA